MAASRCRKEFLNMTIYDTYVFEAEKTYQELYADQVTDWLADHWSVNVWLGVVYVVTIVSLLSFMKTRPPYDLRRPLAVWSASLAIFSFFGGVRTTQELFFILKHHGYQASVCNPSNMFGPTAFWLFLMVLSKIVELGDTIFMILRKQRVIFLHWYHHLTVLMYSSFAYADLTAPIRWFMAMNFSIHAVMYTYYTLRACRVHVPRFVNVFITSIQLLQMVVGLGSTLMVAYYKQAGLACHMSDTNVVAAAAMYFSYLILFANFFNETYLRPSKPSILLDGKKKVK